MPDGEELERLGQSGSTLAIHLSINNIAGWCARSRRATAMTAR